ncbi:MAG: M48 family metallopeptidase [Methanomicrobiaceae archaeon]|nr:M48 family metallopeptidase [Methanomicrobiaceae archaeon]
MEFDGISVSVVRKPVKNIRLSVLSDCTLKVVAPEGYDVSDLLLKKKDWIISHIEKKRSFSEKYEDRLNRMLLYGNYFSVEESGVCSIDYENMTIFYSSVGGLKDFISKRLRTELEVRVKDLAACMGVSCKSLSIRNQKTRWASCSTRGTLSFNIRIAALSPSLRDYIIIHELAHLKEHNHSKNFWSIVENYCPEYKACRGNLKEYWQIIGQNVFWKAMLE